MARRLGLWATAAACAVALGRAQAPATRQLPAIAAASVQWQCRYLACRQYFNGRTVDPRHFDCNRCGPEDEIRSAYGLMNDGQLQGAPGWTSSNGYRIDFTTTAPATRSFMLHDLLPRVLARCFSLRVKKASHMVAGYALVVSRGGIRFKAVKKQPEFQVKDGMASISTIAQLVGYLNQYYYGGRRFGMRRLVRDSTGLTGFYNLRVPADPDGATNLIAVVRRLGLDVKPAPVTATTLQILHIRYLKTSCTFAN